MLQRKLLKLPACLALLLFVVFATQAQTRSTQRVETVKFESKLIGKTLPYIVVLPVGYHSNATTRYPVLYLLHGLTGHYTDWTTRTNIADYAAAYRIIIVMPEGNNSWYIVGVMGASDKYESYILNELNPDVDGRYRTIQSKYGRGVAGLSMGGYGSIKFGLKTTNQFVFAASMSGAFAATRATQQDRGDGWDEFVKTFGPVDSPTRKANDLFELTKALTPARVAALPYFYFDCGTEDSAMNLNANRELADLFIQKKIPHEFRELPGNHSWGYWDLQIQEVLKIAAQKLRMPPEF